jgi:hypothetical protein
MRLKTIWKRCRRWQVAILAALLGLFLLLWWAVSPYILYPVAEVFETPAFAAIDSGMISVKTDNGVLLLRLISHGQRLREGGSPAATRPIPGERDETVYRYDPQKRKFSEVTADVWRSAEGPVAERVGQYGGGPGIMLDNRTHVNKVYKDGRPVSTKGQTALDMASHSRGKLLAIISASGRRSSGFLGFGGSNGATGKYYCEFFTLPDLKRVYSPVYLPMGSTDEALHGCWTADEQYFVITSSETYTGVKRVAIIKMSEVGGHGRIAD